MIIRQTNRSNETGLKREEKEKKKKKDEEAINM